MVGLPAIMQYRPCFIPVESSNDDRNLRLGQPTDDLVEGGELLMCFGMSITCRRGYGGGLAPFKSDDSDGWMVGGGTSADLLEAYPIATPDAND